MASVPRWLRKILLCSMLALTPGAPVWACAICAPSAAEQTLTQRLYRAEAVAIARVLPKAGEFERLVTIRGGADTAARLNAVGAQLPDSGTVLLAYSGGTWNALGAMPVERAPWLDRLIALRRPADANPTAADANWPARFAYFLPDLENPVPLVAQAAYDELASAPYGAMRAASSAFNARALEKWLERGELEARHPLYALMLGFVAQELQVQALQQRLLNTSARSSMPTVSALLAAVIEARGPAGMAWVQAHYLENAQRSDAEVQAALLAVRVHAGASGRLSRDQAIAVARSYIAANPQRAGFVASDLGDWGAWDLVAEFERLMDTEQPQVFASRYAMVLYLLRSPRPEARAALERLRARGRL
ncbi:MAG: hypothetical protein E6Q78_16470 [Rhodoferax sp.]|nr:MAG: hypothetical protein E6Q78_16470 [Rhodoferax sp.]